MKDKWIKREVNGVVYFTTNDKATWRRWMKTMKRLQTWLPKMMLK